MSNSQTLTAQDKRLTTNVAGYVQSHTIDIEALTVWLNYVDTPNSEFVVRYATRDGGFNRMSPATAKRYKTTLLRAAWVTISDV